MTVQRGAFKEWGADPSLASLPRDEEGGAERPSYGACFGIAIPAPAPSADSSG